MSVSYARGYARLAPFPCQFQRSAHPEGAGHLDARGQAPRSWCPCASGSFRFRPGPAGPVLRTINARVETVRTSPAYRPAWNSRPRARRRTSGFYEWQVVGEGSGVVDPAARTRPSSDSRACETGRFPKAASPSFHAPSSLPASPFMAEIHNTETARTGHPQARRSDAWLSGIPDEAFTCRRPIRTNCARHWPVSKRVNSPRNDDEKLISRSVA